MNWNLFVSTFLVISIAELPDKTAFATLILGTQNRPFAVFVGVAAAFVVQTIVAVSFGTVLTFLPHFLVQLTASLLFFVFAFLMWRREDSEEDIEFKHSKSVNFWGTTWKSFVDLEVSKK